MQDDETPPAEPTDEGLTREEIIRKLTMALVAEGNPPLLSKTIAEIFATMYEFRTLIDGLQSSIGGGGGLMGMVGKLASKKR